MKWNNGWEEGMPRMPKTATNKRDGTKKKCATLFVKRNDNADVYPCFKNFQRKVLKRIQIKLLNQFIEQNHRGILQTAN